MGLFRPRLLLAFALLGVPCLASAGLTFELPADEASEAWEPVLEGVGLEAGFVSTTQVPWARLVRQEDACTLDVSPSTGKLIVEPVSCPLQTSEREDIAALAAVMLQPVVVGAISSHRRSILDSPRSPRGADSDSFAATPVDSSRAQVEPEGTAATAPARPRFSSSLEGSDAASIDSSAPSLQAAPPTEAGSRLPAGSRSEGRSLASNLNPAFARSEAGTHVWSVQCHATGCNATFEGSCASADGCSTADKCPGTWWQDKDHDGYGFWGPGQPCLSIDLGASVGSWVQNVGDCDDSHSSRHPGAREVEGDGLDNNCDGEIR